MRKIAKRKGLASASAFICNGVGKPADGDDGAGLRIEVTVVPISDELAGQQTVRQTLFAFLDITAKTVRSGLPPRSLLLCQVRSTPKKDLRPRRPFMELTSGGDA